MNPTHKIRYQKMCYICLIAAHYAMARNVCNNQRIRMNGTMHANKLWREVNESDREREWEIFMKWRWIAWYFEFWIRLKDREREREKYVWREKGMWTERLIFAPDGLFHSVLLLQAPRYNKSENIKEIKMCDNFFIYLLGVFCFCVVVFFFVAIGVDLRVERVCNRYYSSGCCCCEISCIAIRMIAILLSSCMGWAQ